MTRIPANLMWLYLLARIAWAVASAEWRWITGRDSGFRLANLVWAAQEICRQEREAHHKHLERTYVAMKASVEAKP